jgi:hypothetical protein
LEEGAAVDTVSKSHDFERKTRLSVEVIRLTRQTKLPRANQVPDNISGE